MIWSIVAMFSMLVGFPWGLMVVPFGAIAHIGLSWFFKKDHQIMALYVVHEVVPNNLFSGVPSHGEIWRSRPGGYANRLPLN
jgi:hypothetical protein